MSSPASEPGPVHTESAPLLAPEVERAPPPADAAEPAQFPLREPIGSKRADRLLGRLLTALKVGAVLLVIYGLVFNFSVVRGSSMSPGIHDGDRILVNHLTYLLQSVQRGDIVVLRYPLDPSLDYIKRVIGLPGDLVCIHAGCVSVNGEVLVEPYIAEADPRGDASVRVEPEHYYVMGDNRPHSSDSREFGQVPRENLVGKVDLCIWPPGRVHVLE
jgi:signal peptidase I